MWLSGFQGLKGVLSGHPGQVDFPTGKVTFHSHKGPDKSSAN